MPKSPESGNTNAPENTPQNSNSNSNSGASVASSLSSGKARPTSATSADASSSSAPSSTPGRAISERKGQFLIAPRRSPTLQLMGMQPLSFGFVEQTLRAAPDIDVVDTVGPKSIMGVLGDDFTDTPSVLVARMSEQKATMLHQQAQGRLIVERDQALTLLDPTFQGPSLVASATPTGPVLATVVIVLGKDNAPVKDAEVYLFGSLMPATGITDERGQVTLSLFGETAQSIRGLYVKPKADYWSFYQQHPDITTDEANVVALRPLSDWPSLPHFPEKQAYTWGQKIMRLDQLPGECRGQGIKIAIIDSGAATTHDDLGKIRFGFDIINKKTTPNTWNEDVISHGSHCAGVIAGTDSTTGVRGFAPDAEVHVCKLFPGGQTSQLIDALEYCIEKQIDVVNMSLGGAEPSEALEQQIMRAKRAGIACIVAAGNSGGPVQYPAASPNVLAVAAIGKLGEFPTDSYHTQTVTQFVDANGFFSAKFSCFGPEVAVCAPGVAITSSVPANNYAVWDGTSMAAPHITGLAALVLAHHPDFQGPFKARSTERVERLFQVIKLSARRLNLGDPTRTGFGLPDVLVAVGLQPRTGATATTTVTSTPQNTFGSMIGNAGAQNQQAVFAQSMTPFTNMYTDHQNPFGPQAWLGNQWGQIDPAYANYLSSYYQQQQTGSMPGFTFGFGRTNW